MFTPIKPSIMKQGALVLLLLATACSNPQQHYNRFLKACNRVDIIVFNGGDTLFFDTADSTGIDILRRGISGQSQGMADTCAAQGYLRFRQDSTLLLQALFAVTPGTSDARCNYVAYSHEEASHVEGLGERARKLLGTVMQQAAKTPPTASPAQ